jgi:ABC-type amino acid transport substrate-binding protein
VVAAYYIARTRTSSPSCGRIPTRNPWAICLKKGNDQLTQAIEDAIDAMYADGTMAAIAVKYFGYDTTAGVR